MAFQLIGTKFKAWTDAGAPLVGGRVYTTASGTTTFKTVYTDSTLTSSPAYTDDGTGAKYVTLDARGECDMWLGSGAYTIRYTTAAGVTIDTEDGVADPQAAAESAIRADLASTAAGKGASMLGVEDAGGYWTAATQEGVDAEIGAVLRKWVTPTDPRFGGIVSGSWHVAINAAATYAAANGLGVRLLPQSGGYPCNSPVTVPSGVDWEQIGVGSTIYYTRTASAPAIALTLGTIGTVNDHRVFRGIRVEFASTLAWPGGPYPTINDVCVRFAEVHKCTVEIITLVGGTAGYELYGSVANGTAYNTLYVGDILNCRYSEVLKTYSAGFVNQNTFIGGRRGISSAADLLGDAYGTLITWDKSSSYRGQNQNVWLNPCYELSAPAGATDRVPVYLDGAGGYNRWINSRHEGNKGVFAKCDTSSVLGNVFEIGYAGGASTVQDIAETNGSYGNTYKPTKEANREGLTWHSGEIASFVSGRIANTPYISGPFHLVQNSAVVAKAITNGNLETGLEAGIEYFLSRSSAVGVGVFLDTSKTKRFLLSQNSISGFPGRLVINCYDSAGAITTNSGSIYSTAGLNSSVNYGGCFLNGSDTFNSDMLIFGSNVRFARICFVGGTNPLKLISFSITAIGVGADNPINVFSNLPDDGRRYLSSAKPDTAGEHGRYARGNVVENDAVAAGVTTGWPCSLTGRLAKAWAISTAYVVGQMRKNGGNVYVCTTGGTSAGAGGPSGTGTGIADNTVVWDYVCPVATFVTMANAA